jgi:hypothetical protein
MGVSIKINITKKDVRCEIKRNFGTQMSVDTKLCLHDIASRATQL